MFSSFIAAVVATMFVVHATTSNIWGSWECDSITNYCLKTNDIYILFLIFFVLLIILFIRMKGDVDFSRKKTRINLIESIIWILIIWFVIPILIYWFIPINIFYTQFLVTEFDLPDEVYAELFLPWKISMFISLTIPIWTYWILKPFYYWIKKGKGD